MQNSTLIQLLKWGENRLYASGIYEYKNDAFELLSHVFGIDRGRYILEQKSEADPEKQEVYEKLIEKRSSRYPLQYILGYTWFYDLKIKVSESVLIPRFDTETVVDAALILTKDGDSVLDMCTGSGCIILAMAENRRLKKACGVDISENALAVAADNGRETGHTEVEFIKSDLFADLQQEIFDVIISNPPYIKKKDMEDLMDEVRLHEPEIALYGGEDGLIFYKRIIDEGRAFLKNGGYLIFEIGFDEADDIRTYAETHGYIFREKISDLQGLDRGLVFEKMIYETYMFDKLDDILIRYQQIMEELADPDVVKDQKHYTALMKESNDLMPLVEKYKEYKRTKQDIEDSLEMIAMESDPELKEMAKEELSEAKSNLEVVEQELKVLLIPKDPMDDKNVIIEIRAGAGGDEAALFAAELYRLYVKYAEGRRWKCELISVNENGIGGFKEAVFMISGSGVYSRLKYESGVHRVQRVPETESGGRIHTSTATVAIMPEAEEVDVEIDMNDVRIDVFRASGNGGQCVNTTDSAVRITHIPTGIVISCQDEKSQLKNKDKGLRVLRARLLDMEREKKHQEEAALRAGQVGTGDRSEKIRTYNFPQGRCSEHRIKYTTYRLNEIMNGDIDEIIDHLIAAEQAAKLSQVEQGV